MDLEQSALAYSQETTAVVARSWVREMVGFLNGLAFTFVLVAVGAVAALVLVNVAVLLAPVLIVLAYRALRRVDRARGYA